MKCDTVLQILADHGWDADERQHIGQALDHARSCEGCQGALADYGRVRGLLTGDSTDDAEPAGGWTGFEARLLHAAARPQRRAWGWVALVAASLLLGLALGRVLLGGNDPSKTNSGEFSMAALTPAEVAEHKLAFGKISEVFEGRTGWVLMSTRDSDLGVSDSRSKPGGKLLFLRLVMTREGKAVSQADLVVVAGEAAEPVITLADGRKLKYRVVCPLDGGKGVEVYVNLGALQGNGRPAAALSAHLADRGDGVQSVGSLVTPEGRYDLNVGLSWSTL